MVKNLMKACSKNVPGMCDLYRSLRCNTFFDMLTPQGVKQYNCLFPVGDDLQRNRLLKKFINRHPLNHMLSKKIAYPEIFSLVPCRFR